MTEYAFDGSGFGGVTMYGVSFFEDGRFDEGFDPAHHRKHVLRYMTTVLRRYDK